ncbi:MAG: hypothetical protein GY755_23965 [Chloroflexi bacterium]|nr:hypothetical protein [Chloroflexota bacterium]
MLQLILIIALLVGFLWWGGKKELLPQSSKFDLTTWFLAIAQSLILSLSFGFFIWTKTENIPQQYSDFISGNIGFSVQNKTSDLYALYATVIAFTVFFIIILKLYDKVFDNKIFSQGAVKLSLYSLVPFAILVGQSLRMSKTIKLLALSLFFISLSLAIIFILHFLYKKEYLQQDKVFIIGSKIILGIIFLGLSEVGFSVFLSRLGFFPYTIGLFSFLIVVSYAIILITHKKKNKEYKRKIDLGVAFSQLGIPLLFFILASPPVLLKNGVQTFFPYNPILYIFLYCLSLISLVSIYKNFKVGQRAEKRNSLSVSPWMLIAILVYIQSSRVGWPSISLDEYHSGEFYLPWWLFQHFDYLPFLDYQPARGLVNYIPGFLSQLFYDGTFSGQSMVQNHFVTLYLFLAFFSLRLIAGDFLAFLSVFSLFSFAGSSAGGPIVAISSLVILFASVSKNSDRDFIKSLWLWVGLSFFVVFFMVAEGGVFVLGTLPLGVYILFKVYHYSKKKLLIFFGIIIFVGGILALTTDTTHIIISLIRYLIEQSGVNDVAHGIIWQYPSSSINTSVTSGYLWQFVRFSWLLLIIPIVVLLSKKGDNLWRKKDVFFLIALFIMSILIIPRAAGRIDATTYSRPGEISIGFILCGLPLVALHFVKNHIHKAKIVLGIALIFGLIGNQEVTLSRALRLHQYVADEPSSIVSGSTHKLENIGEEVVMDNDQLLRQTNIKGVLDGILLHQETYYDVTNHNADYGFQGKPNPVVDTAFYNAPTEQQQLRTIEELQTKSIHLALVDSNNILHDGGPLSLRSFWVYRFLLNSYTPFIDHNGYTWMILKSKTNRATSSGFHLGSKNEEVDLLSDIFWQKDLAGLPASWGQSIKHLDQKTENPVNLLVTGKILDTHNMTQDSNNEWNVIGKNHYIILEIPAGAKGDMLYLETDRNIEKHSYQVFWINDIVPTFAEENSFVFEANGTQFMVPLSAAPSWELSEMVTQIKINLPKNFSGKIHFNKIILYDRTDIR